MRLSRQSHRKYSLSPIEPEALLHGLELTTGKAAELCDISPRQLRYWADHGIIETVGDEEERDGDESDVYRTYHFTALRKVLLIKQLMDMGHGLKRATREAELYLKQSEDARLKADADRQVCEEMLQQQTNRLLAISEQVRSAMQRGRISRADLRDIAFELHYLLKLLPDEDCTTLQLQRDVNAINQFRAMIDQFVLYVEDKVADTLSGHWQVPSRFVRRMP
ncbi:MAG: MerR family DNA-binding transcriptional regulator [Armatimonadota bacterium]